MSYKLSLIIPIYNVEQYLKECLDSVVAQGYKDLEVLLIDDGSSDSSAAICKSYIQKYPYFHYYYKENGGLSSARNFGLKLATGDYVSFLDSDDFLSSDIYAEAMALLACYDKANKLALCFQYMDFGGDDSGRISPSFAVKDGTCSFEFLDNERPLNKLALGRINNAVWNKIYPASIIKKLSFIEGRICEDATFNYLALERCEGLFLFSKVGYYYRMDHSDTSLSKGRKRLYQDFFWNCDQVESEGLVLNSKFFYRFQIRHLSHILRKEGKCLGKNYCLSRIKYLAKSINYLGDYLRYIPKLYLYYWTKVK